MKKLLLLSFSIFSLSFVNAQSEKFEWAKNLGGGYADFGYSIAVDVSGNVFTTGVFTDTADFDPGTAKFNLKTSGANDIFISKLDATGKFVWAKKIGGATNDAGYAIALDGTGNAIITGGFTGTVDFDPGIGVSNLTASGSVMDIFIAKFDPNGTLIWAKSIGGSLTDYGSSLAIDATGNIYSTGFFYSTVDFDPDATAIVNLSSAGNSDIFILKLNSAGRFVWAKSIGSASADAGRSIALDANNNVYTTGSFSVTADFDPGLTEFKLTTVGGSDIFVSKLDASGNFVWAKSMGGSSNEEGTSIVSNSAGQSVITGQFLATVDFNPGTGTTNLTSIGDKDIFILKLDGSGNMAWVKQIGGLLTDLGLSLALDSKDNIYTTGSFKGTVDFDPGTAKLELTSLGTEDVYIVKLDASGSYIWAKKIGETGSDVAQSIAVSKTKSDIYVTGYFSGTVDFDPDATRTDMASNGLSDIFVEKIIANLGAIPLSTIDDITFYPNPTHEIVYLNFGQHNTKEINIQVINSTGQLVLTLSDVQDSKINLHTLPSGLYNVNVFYKNQSVASQRILKI